MVLLDVKKIALMGKKKIAYMDANPMGYIILSILAGIYVGFGITLIFNIGAPFAVAGSAATKVVMGASFGVALTLVIFAGSELFTGNNMFGVVGAMSKEIKWSKVGKIFALSLFGNLIGSLFIAFLVTKSGSVSGEATQFLIQKVAAAKMNKPAMDLFLLGILCNWLVCLAVWTSARTTNDAAKIMLIFWCLFAFIGSGFEHSIANQTLLGIALFSPHGELVTWGGFLWNQVFVIAGNVVGGGFFVGALYWFASPFISDTKEITTELAADESSSAVPTES